MHNYKLSESKGFTLIELAIVMVIVGLFVASALGAYSLYFKQKQITVTKGGITAVTAALQKYQDDNGFYPCPADPADLSGIATDCSAAPTANIKRIAVGSRFVRIGVVPMVDLSGNTKLSDPSQRVDGYRRLLTYAVTEHLAQDMSLFVPNSGAITILNEDGGGISSNGSFVVLSHGADGSGAYSQSGGPAAACVPNQKDTENCNNDATFMVTDVRNFASGNNYNDDFANYVTATSVDTTKTCPNGTILRGLKANGDLICTNDLSCPPHHAFTGLLKDGVTPNCQQITALCTAGEVLVNMTMGSAPTCIKNMSGACPAGFVQRGTNDNPQDKDYGKPLCLQILSRCPDRYVQVGMQEQGQPVCVPNLHTACPGNQVQVGNDSNGAAICKSLSCPGGQYFYGISNGNPLCSGDRSVNNNTCPTGQYVYAINNDVISCRPVDNPNAGYGSIIGIGILTEWSKSTGNTGGWEGSGTNCGSVWGAATCATTGWDRAEVRCSEGRMITIAIGGGNNGCTTFGCVK